MNEERNGAGRRRDPSRAGRPEERKQPEQARRAKYVAPPRTVYEPSKLLGIESYATPSAPKEAAHLVSTLLDIVEDGNGSVKAVTNAKLLEDYGDSYAAQCEM